MSLSYANFLRLKEALRQGHLSPACRLVGLRMASRHVIEAHHRDKRALDRKIEDAKRHLPFTARKVLNLMEVRDDLRRTYRQALIGLGKDILEMDGEARRRLTFDRVADALAINKVHRADARAFYQEYGLLGILFIDRFEESATYRPMLDRDGGWFALPPASDAVMAYFIEWMRMRRMAGGLSSPFAPGSPFHGASTYRRQPDGALARQLPALVVHDRDGGQQVVERAPEVRS